MCLAAFELGPEQLLLAANRDEFLARAAEPLQRWPQGWLGGRDVQAGGSWLLRADDGRLALVTNVREPTALARGQRSRGELPQRVLQGEDLLALAEGPWAGFNLLLLDPAQGRGWWCSNRPRPQLLALGPGRYGLSNAQLDTPWPKLLRLKAALDGPAVALWQALRDQQVAPDGDLPDTGVGRLRERQLSSAFVRIAGEDGEPVYGTRCSTLLVQQPEGFQLTERRWDAQGGLSGETVISA